MMVAGVQSNSWLGSIGRLCSRLLAGQLASSALHQAGHTAGKEEAQAGYLQIQATEHGESPVKSVEFCRPSCVSAMVGWC